MAPHRMVRPALALFLVALSGCSEESVEPCIPPPIPIIKSLPGQGLVMVGQQARLRVPPTVSSGCGLGGDLAPTSATVEIEGPDGEPLAGEISLGQGISAATVRFTPERPGPHHLLILFSEVGGLHQLDVQAVRDRSDEAPSETLSTTCSSLERTRQGTWVCGSSVIRGDALLGSFPGARLAVAGDVVWVADGSNIRRFLDTGTEFALTGSFTNPISGADFLVPSEDELVVLHSTALALYTFSGGLLTLTDTIPWSRPSSSIATDGPYGVLLREGDHLALATRGRTVNSTFIQVCSYQLTSGMFQLTPGTCPRFPGEIVGFEPGVLWTRDVLMDSLGGTSSGLVSRLVLRQGQLVEEASVSLGLEASFSIRSLFRPTAVPVLGNPPSNGSPHATSVLTWSPQRKAILLEQLDPEMTDASASSTLFWGKAPSSSAAIPTKVRLRPPPL